MFFFSNRKVQKSRRRLVVFTGAGMSAESGISTFRGNGGLWENHDLREVASHEGWVMDPYLVLRFYNERRKQMRRCQPNEGHLALARLEEQFDVQIITQNVDDLHERAGSTRVLHLHGELTKVRSCKNPDYVRVLQGDEIHVGDLCPEGGQLRPHIVWFGEEVPLFDTAVASVETADLFVVIGTSLAVYPAASLVDYVPAGVPIYLIDPEPTLQREGISVLRMGASEGVAELERMIASRDAREGRPVGVLTSR
jgi:NAD-dependent deacetylase